MGDWVRQFMLSPPFAWRWNRAITTFTASTASQDNTKAMTDFGWIERATVDNTATSKELGIQMCLPGEVTKNLPTKIAALTDSGTSVVFRLLPLPDKAYNVSVIYQKLAPNFTATSGTWDPIPDYLFYVYSQGMLAKAYEYLGDERWQVAMQLFIKHLVSANGGLDDTQANIFLRDHLDTQRGMQAALLRSQQGTSARGLGMQ
jgi:hypothetical protein